MTGIPLKEKGRIIKVLDVGSDITERKKAEELERFGRLSVGRELKMVELKKRVNELEGKLKKNN